MSTRHWLFSHPFVHGAAGRDKFLFYNTLTHGHLVVPREGDPLDRLLAALMDWRRPCVAAVSEADLAHPRTRATLDALRASYMADLVPARGDGPPPVQFQPHPFMQYNYRRMREAPAPEGEDVFATNETLQCLDEVSLYLTTAGTTDYRALAQAHRQFLFPMAASAAPQHLEVDRLEALLVSLRQCRLLRLNLLGGDLFAHPDLERVARAAQGLACRVTLTLSCDDALAHREALRRLVATLGEGGAGGEAIPQPQLVLLPETRAEDIARADAVLGDLGLPYVLLSVLRSVDDAERAATLSQGLRPDDRREEVFRIFFTGDNGPFVLQTLAVTEEEILQQPTTLRDIFVNMTCNRDAFGRLVVTPAGDLHANLNHRCLGNLATHSLGEVIARELREGQSWLNVREAVAPCSGCHLRALCRPLSNYEISLQRNDLCEVSRAAAT